jgi:hypothetical protein
MSGRRWFLSLCALPLLAAAPAAAAPPGQAVVFDEHAVREPVSQEGFFPCLGAPGMEDDEAQITGLETRRIKVTAAGLDDEGLPLAPFRAFVSIRQRVSVDPLLAGLPTFTATAHSLFQEQMGDIRQHVVAHSLFRATADDGTGTLTFRFRHVFVMGPDGVIRVDRTVEGCETS